MRFYKVIILLLYFGRCFLKVSSTEIEFTGQNFVKFDFRPNTTKTADNAKTAVTILQLTIRTIHLNGVLFYRQGTATDGDFLQLELDDGALRLTGIFKASSFGKYYDDYRHVNNNKWHNVTVEVSGLDISLLFNSQKLTDRFTSAGYVEELSTKNSSLFVAMARPGQNSDRKNYTGCLKTAIFMGLNLLSAYPAEFRNCSKKADFPVQFQSSLSFLELSVTNSLQHVGSFRASFTFRTYEKRGVLFSVIAMASKFRLRLNSSSLLCEEIIVSDRNPTLLVLGSNLNDGEWHSVLATLNGTTKRLEVSLDGYTEVRPGYSPPKVFLGMSRLNILLGKDEEEPGFGGCIFHLQVNSHHYETHEFEDMNSHETKLGECKLKNHCSPNPCKNNGHCTVEGKHSTCTCEAQFEGPKCEDSIYKSTCEMYVKQGLTTNASCHLGTSKESKYIAMCETPLNDTMYTVLEPAVIKVREIKVDAGEDLESDSVYVHHFRYQANSMQLDILKKDSKECRQDLKFYSFCGSETDFPNEHAFWNDDKASNSGIRTAYCKKSMHCSNCNFTVSEKTKLPVMILRFHKKYSKASFTIGPLRCLGRSQKDSEAKQTVIQKDNKKLEKVCLKIARSTSAPTLRITEKALYYTPSVYRGCDESRKPTDGLCISYSSKTIDSFGSPPTNPSLGKAASGKQTDSTANKELSMALVVFLSSSLVLALVLAVKLGLPSCLMCLRMLSKRGEYRVPKPEDTCPDRPSKSVVSYNGERYKYTDCNRNSEAKSSYWV